MLAALRYSAARLLTTLFDPRLTAVESAAKVATLAPRAEDFDAVLVTPAVAGARKRCAAAWARRPFFRRPEGHDRFLITAALTGQLESARLFPGEYRRGKGNFRPGVALACWRWGSAEGLGPIGDGLVAIGGRWVWFPSLWATLDDVTREVANATRWWVEA